MYQRVSPVRLLGKLCQGFHRVFNPVAVARYLQMALPDTWHTRHTHTHTCNRSRDNAGTDAVIMTAVESSPWVIFQFPNCFDLQTYNLAVVSEWQRSCSHGSNCLHFVQH